MAVVIHCWISITCNYALRQSSSHGILWVFSTNVNYWNRKWLWIDSTAGTLTMGLSGPLKSRSIRFVMEPIDVLVEMLGYFQVPNFNLEKIRPLIWPTAVEFSHHWSCLEECFCHPLFNWGYSSLNNSFGKSVTFVFYRNSHSILSEKQPDWRQSVVRMTTERQIGEANGKF